MKKMLRYLILSSTFLLVIGMLQGCVGKEAVKDTKEISSEESKEDFKTEIDAITYVYNKYLNLVEDHQAIRYYFEDMTMPGVLTPYNVTEFIYDQEGNAKSFQMSGEVYLIDGIAYSRSIAKSLQNDTLTIISDELIESSEPTDYFTRNLGNVKELVKNILNGYLKVESATDIKVEGQKDNLEMTLKNITFENEKLNEQIKNGELALEKVIITDKDNELTIQIVTKDYTNKVILTPNYQQKVEKPQLYQKGDTLEYDGATIREIHKNNN